ncbi:hypothetical protein E2C01_037259 [Portunus trituberculatus]|uniref:Retrotransposon gag domain-containing protein n=1 Tax=Portunus trituberculatus TaxID=210409 RepID=A0A5B7FEH3_PORTR|nr:hypothetical protein [Portunus trituberculatus]
MHYNPTSTWSVATDPTSRDEDEILKVVVGIKVVSMAAVTGAVEQYIEGEDFEAYMDRFGQSLEVNNIVEDKKKRALFLTDSEPVVYQLLKNLCSPEKPADKSLKELFSLAAQQYATKDSVAVERFKFSSQNQRENQTISNYMAELKRKASKCYFGGNLNENLRDRFVWVPHIERIQWNLLQEGDELTWDKACKLELSTKAKMLAVGNRDRHVNKVEQPRTTPQNWKRQLDSKGAKVQNARFFPRLGKTNGAPGHTRRMCRARGRFNKLGNANEHESSQEEEEELFDILQLPEQEQTRIKTPPLVVNEQVEGNELRWIWVRATLSPEMIGRIGVARTEDARSKDSKLNDMLEKHSEVFSQTLAHMSIKAHLRLKEGAS